MVRDGGVVTITNAAALDNVPHDVAVRQQHLRYQKNQNAVLEPRTGMLYSRIVADTDISLLFTLISKLY